VQLGVSLTVEFVVLGGISVTTAEVGRVVKPDPLPVNYVVWIFESSLTNAVICVTHVECLVWHTCVQIYKAIVK